VHLTLLLELWLVILSLTLQLLVLLQQDPL
jgi:hypothetical protein